MIGLAVRPGRGARGAQTPVRGHRVGWRDLFDEAIAGALARPGRAALTSLGTVLGIAAVVATMGIARSAGEQLLGRFDELAATGVVIAPSNAAPSAGERPGAVNPLPFGAEDRLLRLRGVVAAGSFARLDVGGALVRSVPLNDPLAANEFQLPVMAVSPGLGEAVRATMLTGRWFDRLHDERAERVAVLGPLAAERLQIDRVGQQPAVFIGEEAFVVVGVIEEVARLPDLLGAVLLPEGTAADRFDLQAPDEVVIETAVGAGRLIGRQAPVALSPNAPELLLARVPPDGGAVRRGAASDVDALFVLLGGVSVVVGALGIANVTLVSVLQRTGEFGLRRALGATRSSVVGLVLLESGVLGALGGLVGGAAGLVTVAATAAVRDWTPVLDWRTVAAAPLVGTAVGLLAGVHPSWRAGAVEPADALRAGSA